MLANIFENLESVMCRILLGSFVTLVFIQIISRQFFDYSFSWIEELAIYLFVWFAYFGASYAALKGTHNRVTFQFKKMSPKKRMAFEILADSVWVAFNCYFVWLSSEFVLYRINKFWEAQTLGIPMKYLYVVLPIAFTLITIRVIQFNYRKNVLKQDIKDPDAVEYEEIQNMKDPESEK